MEKTYTTSRLFRSVACYLSPALKTASLPTPSNHPSTSPLHSPQRQLEPQISLRFLASYRTLIYLFIFWLFCRITSLNTLLVVLLWILLLAVMLLYHLRPRYEKNKWIFISPKERESRASCLERTCQNDRELNRSKLFFFLVFFSSSLRFLFYCHCCRCQIITCNIIIISLLRSRGGGGGVTQAPCPACVTPARLCHGHRRHRPLYQTE